ncbi:MAG: adenylyltransferase/cytidyltransferase family protein [Thermoguttaceae bacterium]
MPAFEQRVQLIQQLHRSPKQLVLASSGGGSLAISDLLTVPGASQTLIEAHVPYSAESVARFIGSAPVHYCSSQTARQLAMTCFKRGQSNAENRAFLLDRNPSEEQDRPLFRHQQVAEQQQEQQQGGGLREGSEDQDPLIPLVPSYHEKKWLSNLIGIGCSASLASNRPKLGEHRFHVAIQTYDRTSECFLTLHKGARTRFEEERLVADCILQQIALAAQLNVSFEPELLPEEHLETQTLVANESWIELLFGNGSAVLHIDGKQYCLRRFGDSGRPTISVDHPQSPEVEYMQHLFAGSFDPFHRGHLRMLELAQEHLSGIVALEMTVQNVDKPPLDYREMELRLAQIERVRPGQAIWLTQTPRFVDKARLFPNSTFIVGADTLRRIGQQTYYGNNHGVMMDVLRQITYCRCRFLVFARRTNGNVENLQSLHIPDILRSLCDSISEEEFCEDISSREIRAALLYR